MSKMRQEARTDAWREESKFYSKHSNFPSVLMTITENGDYSERNQINVFR